MSHLASGLMSGNCASRVPLTAWFQDLQRAVKRYLVAVGKAGQLPGLWKGDKSPAQPEGRIRLVIDRDWHLNCVSNGYSAGELVASPEPSFSLAGVPP